MESPAGRYRRFPVDRRTRARSTLDHFIYVPITFTGLTSPSGFTVFIDDQPVNQSIHGHDFWQADYDAMTRRWSLTYNLPIDDKKPHTVGFSRGR